MSSADVAARKNVAFLGSHLLSDLGHVGVCIFSHLVTQGSSVGYGCQKDRVATK
jgi:hypothetical protein